jgi:hypothetical protein
MARRAESFDFDVADHGRTSARVYRAGDPSGATLVLAHGAGAPQTHPFMVDVAQRLARRGIDVVTFDFLYRANGKRLPDRNEVLEATWRAAIASVRARAGLPTAKLFIGGKSMGGRIASQVAAARDVPSVAGLVLLGYPLHPPGKPKVRRDAHLARVPCKVLFVQGSRDSLGDAEEIGALVKTLPRAELHVVTDGDHSLALPKRIAGADGQEAALEAAADAIARFVRGGKRR